MGRTERYTYKGSKVIPQFSTYQNNNRLALILIDSEDDLISSRSFSKIPNGLSRYVYLIELNSSINWFFSFNSKSYDSFINKSFANLLVNEAIKLSKTIIYAGLTTYIFSYSLTL